MTTSVGMPVVAQLFEDIHRIKRRMNEQARLQRESLVVQILNDPRYGDARHLSRFEAQVYAQHGEDGILSEIFRRIGTTDCSFLEIGVENGEETNTTYRLAQGWHGYWVEANESEVEEIQHLFAVEIARGQLEVIPARVTKENVSAILDRRRVPVALDLLSIDVDLNTSYIWRALAHLRPRVAVIEYNASIPRDDEWEVEYRPEGDWDGSVNFGASLKTLQLYAESIGYTLVGCELSGTNAFFVRTDLVNDQFAGPFTSTALYEPPRYFTFLGDWGHRRRHRKEVAVPDPRVRIDAANGTSAAAANGASLTP